MRGVLSIRRVSKCCQKPFWSQWSWLQGRSCTLDISQWYIREWRCAQHMSILVWNLLVPHTACHQWHHSTNSRSSDNKLQQKLTTMSLPSSCHIQQDFLSWVCRWHHHLFSPEELHLNSTLGWRSDTTFKQLPHLWPLSFQQWCCPCQDTCYFLVSWWLFLLPYQWSY